VLEIPDCVVVPLRSPVDLPCGLGVARHLQKLFPDLSRLSMDQYDPRRGVYVTVTTFFNAEEYEGDYIINLISEHK